MGTDMFSHRMDVFYSSWVIDHLHKSTGFPTYNDPERKVLAGFYPVKIEVKLTVTTPVYSEHTAFIVCVQISVYQNR